MTEKDDARLLIASVLGILGFTAAVLRLPVFAFLALLCVLASIPIATACYVGPLGLTKLPVITVVSFYLMLGIGVRAICQNLSHHFSSTEQR